MPKRPPSLAERLRSAWATGSASTGSRGAAAVRHGRQYKGSQFADRLRAAVASRH
jgi:hypothetical protein